MSRIPQVNLKDYLSGDASSKEKFIKDIGKGFSEVGFVAVKGHLLNDEVKESLYKEVRQFFSLPDNIKSKYIIKGLASQRGFTPFGKEHAKGKNVGDLKEFWHFGQYVKNEPKMEDKYPENVIVEELENFNKIGQKTYELLEDTGRHILRSIACYLDLEETYFDMLSRHTNNKLKSTIHRVVNPPKSLWNSSRYSIPFFLHPRLEMPLNCIDSCVDENNPKGFEDITAGDFLYQRLVDLGLVKD